MKALASIQKTSVFTFYVLSLFLLIGNCNIKDDPSPSYEVRRQELTKNVIDNYLPQDSTVRIITIFATLEPLNAGTPISPALNANDFLSPPPVYTMSTDFWLFIVDRYSMAKFAHDVSYIFIPEDGTPHEIHEEKWWPIINNNLTWYYKSYLHAPQYVVFQGDYAEVWRANEFGLK